MFPAQRHNPVHHAEIPPTSPLKSWTVLVDGDIPPSTFDRVRTHPRYREIARRFMSGSLELAAQDKRVDGVFKDLGRYAATVWSIYLHFTGGLTLPRLKEICARSRILSPGRARALLIYLQLLGYVKALPKSTRRPTQYAPNPALIAAIKAQLLLGLEGLALVDPHLQTVIDHIQEPEVFRALIIQLGEGALNASVAVDQRGPFFEIFAARYAGMQLLYLMLVDIIDHEGNPPGKVDISVADAARRLNVARSHVARLLSLAEKAKLITRFDDGAIRLSDELRHESDLSLCLQLVGYAISAAHAYEVVQNGRRKEEPTIR